MTDYTVKVHLFIKRIAANDDEKNVRVYCDNPALVELALNQMGFKAQWLGWNSFQSYSWVRVWDTTPEAIKKALVEG